MFHNPFSPVDLPSVSFKASEKIWGYPFAHYCPTVLGRCYFPDGKTVASQDVPCNSNGGNSTCCGPGYACMSNNICKVTEYTQNVGTVQWIRGSCTDQNWNDGNCPSFCQNPEADDKQDGGIGMRQCPYNDKYFICMDHNEANADCQKGEGVVVFRASPSTVTIIGITTSTSSSSSTRSSTSTPSTSSSSSTTLPPPSSSIHASQAMSILPAPDPSSKSSSNLGVAVGAGVGIPLGLIALGVVGYILFRIRRTRKRDEAAMAAAMAAAQNGHSGYQDPPPDTYPGLEMASKPHLWTVPVEIGSEDLHELPVEHMRGSTRL
ncbi:hypothetical protein GQ43DRAFT_490844 [Delitschia confertaspora ATCC 74209]|uniref:Mid2 domain-containing protein n=1 Tax=Delitschia confertaspora ATCC 74209 TaxID=1513339 RepID=A0A9P4MW99_9PLEO|nr:hypothetical protein GQ43DRAFT_490844 [Delitschia confertaspora ATCC 74209]